MLTYKESGVNIEEGYKEIIGYKPDFYVVDISDGTGRIE